MSMIDGLEDVSESCGLDLNVATLAAGKLSDGMLFQVHRSGVVVANPSTGTSTSSFRFRKVALIWYLRNGQLIKAKITTNLFIFITQESDMK